MVRMREMSIHTRRLVDKSIITCIKGLPCNGPFSYIRHVVRLIHDLPFSTLMISTRLFTQITCLYVLMHNAHTRSLSLSPLYNTTTPSEPLMLSNTCGWRRLTNQPRLKYLYLVEFIASALMGLCIHVNIYFLKLSSRILDIYPCRAIATP